MLTWSDGPRAQVTKTDVRSDLKTLRITDQKPVGRSAGVHESRPAGRDSCTVRQAPDSDVLPVVGVPDVRGARPRDSSPDGRNVGQQ
jgi:hypothetical protein